MNKEDFVDYCIRRNEMDKGKVFDEDYEDMKAALLETMRKLGAEKVMLDGKEIL